MAHSTVVVRPDGTFRTAVAVPAPAGAGRHAIAVLDADGTRARSGFHVP